MRKNLIDFLVIALPAVVGVVSFTVVVKWGLSGKDVLVLAVYQGCAAYFSLIALGLSYINSRRSIFGWKIVPLLVFVVSIPTAYFIGRGIPVASVASIVWAVGITSATSFIYLLLRNRRAYLVFQYVASAMLPLSMVVETAYSLMFCITLSGLVCIKVRRNRAAFLPFSYSGSGAEFLKSLLIQSPLFVLPFFDIYIVEKIGQSEYSKYALVNKYVTGLVNLGFSRLQFNLVFFSAGLNFRKSIVQLLILIPFVIVFSYYQHLSTLIMSVALLAYGINISSLCIRKLVIDGISMRFACIGALAVALYYYSLIFFDQMIRDNHWSFIALMLIVVSLPVIVCAFSAGRKQEKR